MDKKTVGLIATIGTLFVCACPSIFLCAWGVFGVAGIPIDQTFNGQTSSQPMSTALGVGLLCLSIIGLLTPVVIGFVTLRKKPEAQAINAAPMTSPTVESDPFANDAVESAPFDNAPLPTSPKAESSPFDDDNPIPPAS